MRNGTKKQHIEINKTPIELRIDFGPASNNDIYQSFYIDKTKDINTKLAPLFNFLGINQKNVMKVEVKSPK